MGTSPIGIPPVSAGAEIFHFFSDRAWIDGRSHVQLEQVATWAGMIRVAGFPDLHVGKYGPVGAAFLADRIYPQLVGTDIGCGMSVHLLDLSPRKLSLDKAVRRLTDLELPFEDASNHLEECGLPTDLALSLGSIGGGNHFVEIQTVAEVFDEVACRAANFDPTRLCLLVHTGSRGLGAGIFQAIEDRWNLGFAPESEAATTYLERHDLALRWASLNRRILALRVAIALRCDYQTIADVPHNLLERTKAGWLHRKGSARVDSAVLPLAGSRDSLSFLIAPTGATDISMASLPHGAGRKHDRSSMHGRIRKQRSELERMQRNPWGGRIVCEDSDLLIEEAGAAYKSATTVLEDVEQLGLARRAASLKPLLTYKRSRQGDVK